MSFPSGAAETMASEHIGLFQPQQGSSCLLLLLVCKGIVVCYGAVGFADLLETYTLG